MERQIKRAVANHRVGYVGQPLSQPLNADRSLLEAVKRQQCDNSHSGSRSA